MASVKDLRTALAELFGESEMRIKALSQSLSAANLRTHGGVGRGAAQMTGRDVAMHAIALAMQLPTKDAAQVIKSLDEMPLQHGSWFHEDKQFWTFDRPSHIKSAVLSAIAKATKGEEGPFPVYHTFGEFVGAWVDGIFEPQLGRYQEGQTELTLDRDCPHARFIFEGHGDAVELRFYPDGFTAPPRRSWEHPLIIREELFHKLASIVS